MQGFFKALTGTHPPNLLFPPPCQLPTRVTMQSSYFLHPCPRAVLAGDWADGLVYKCAPASAELWKHPPSPAPHSSLPSPYFPPSFLDWPWSNCPGPPPTLASCAATPHPRPVRGLSLCWGTRSVPSFRLRRELATLPSSLATSWSVSLTIARSQSFLSNWLFISLSLLRPLD